MSETTTTCMCPECGEKVAVPGALAWCVRACERCSCNFVARPESIVATLRARPSAAPPTPDSAPLVCVLEDIRSAFNVGSMFRTCDGLGWRHVCLVGITASAAHKEVAKTALGAERFVHSSYHASAVGLLEALTQNGYECVALELTPRAVALADFVARGPIALVVGNEVTGVSPEAQRRCTRAVQIPMRGEKASFNAAVAFGIAAYAMSAR